MTDELKLHEELHLSSRNLFPETLLMLAWRKPCNLLYKYSQNMITGADGLDTVLKHLSLYQNESRLGNCCIEVSRLFSRSFRKNNWNSTSSTHNLFVSSYRTVSCNGFTLHLYSKGMWSDSRPGNQLFWLSASRRITRIRWYNETWYESPSKSLSRQHSYSYFRLIW